MNLHRLEHQRFKIFFRLTMFLKTPKFEDLNCNLNLMEHTTKHFVKYARWEKESIRITSMWNVTTRLQRIALKLALKYNIKKTLLLGEGRVCPPLPWPANHLLSFTQQYSQFWLGNLPVINYVQVMVSACVFVVKLSIAFNFCKWSS